MRNTMKWTTAFVASFGFAAVGCESDSGDETGTTDTTDSTDGADATDAADGDDATDGTEAGDGADATDTVDATDATDGTDGIDATDAVDATDAEDGSDVADATDGSDATDGDPATCPQGSKCNGAECCTCSGSECELGIDNSLSGIASLANSALQETIDAGDVNIVAEFVGDTTKTFTLNMYTADLDPTDAACDIAVGPCKWQLGLEAFNADCGSLISFNNAAIDADGKLTAGGPDGLFVLSLPIQGFVLELKVVGARIVGEVTMDGENITGLTGILAGAVPKAALAEAVDNLPDEGLPLPKPAIKNLLENVIKADIDAFDAAGTAGTDGVKESASVSIVFEGVPGTIASLEPADGQDPAPACAAPPAIETFSQVAFRMSGLSLGDSGKAGQGLDVDGVCAPPPEVGICE